MRFARSLPAKYTEPLDNERTAEHRLHPLPRHRPLPPAVRPPGRHAEHPAARRPGAAVPQRVRRRAVVLAQPRRDADRPLAALQRDERARAPRVRARRPVPAHPPHAARRRLLDRDGGGAARLRRPEELGYDVVGRRGHHPRPRRRAGRRARCCATARASRSSSPSASSRPTATTSSRPRSATRSTRSRPPNLPDTPVTRRDMAAFKQSARALDHGVGAVLGALDEQGIADDTLVIFTTDHGLPFPGAKATLSDRGLGVLLIMRGPGGFHGGRVYDALVSQIDLFPTLCDLDRDRHPRRTSRAGRSSRTCAATTRGRQRRGLRRADLPRGLRPAARDPHAPAQVRPPLRRPRPAGAAERRRQPVQGPAARARPGGDAAPARGALRPAVRPERGAQPRRRTRTTRTCSPTCASSSTTWMMTTDDPLLEGSVAAPPGAEVNDPAGSSPSETPGRDSGAIR